MAPSGAELDTLSVAAARQEGFGAPLDPQGSIDRQLAQRELRRNFEIVAEDAPREAGSQVTEVEFERIARLYSDIRLGRTHLHVDSTSFDAGEERAAAHYRRNLMGQLGRILQTGTGRALVDELAHNEHGHDVNFQRYRDASGREVRNDATAMWGSRADAEDPRKGTDSTVSINPGVDDYVVGRPTDAWRHQRGDVALFHELTHALHEVNGTLDPRGAVEEEGLDHSWRDLSSVEPIAGYEHQAVGLGRHRRDRGPNENRYRRERASIGAHGGDTVVPGDVGMAQRTDYSI
jgi:hypothetical protein